MMQPAGHKGLFQGLSRVVLGQEDSCFPMDPVSRAMRSSQEARETEGKRETLADHVDDGRCDAVWCWCGIDHSKPIGFFACKLKKSLTDGLMETRDFLLKAIAIAGGIPPSEAKIDRQIQQQSKVRRNVIENHVMQLIDHP